MRLYLARHGESLANERRIVQGDLVDEGLSQLGRAQALALADHFLREKERGLHLDAIYSSPLKRALETADAVARAVRAPPPLVLPGLRETSWGRWMGRPEAEAKEAIGRARASWRSGEPDARVEGGESAREVWERAGAHLLDMSAGHKHDTILVVAHDRVNRIALSMLLHDAFEHADEFPQTNAAYTQLDHEGGKWYAPVRNAVDHLREARCLPSSRTGRGW